MMEHKNLGDLATVVRGSSPRPMGDPRYFGGDIPWVKISDVTASDGRILLKTKNGVTEAGKEKSRLVKKGELIVSNSGSVGKPIFMGIDGCIHDGFLTFLNISPDITKEWLYWFFIWYKDRIKAKANTGTQLNLNTSIVKSLKIPLPPLAQQKKIAGILDAADAFRQKTKALINKYEELTQSLFLDMFGDPVTNPMGWEKNPIANLTSRIVVGHVGPTSDGYTSDGITFLRTQNVRRNYINYNDIMYISEEFHEKLKKSKIFEGDILISRVGVNRGMAAMVPNNLNDANCANVVIIGNSKLFNSLFLSYFLNRSFGTKPEYGYSVGSAQGVVNTSIVKKWPIFSVPIDLQTQFAERVQAIESQKAQAQQSLDKSEDLFNCLLQKAFKGELTA